MDWFRHYHGCAFDPKWRTVARRTGQTVERVAFVWDTLMEYASANPHDRGSIRGWSAEIVADHLMCDVEVIESIYKEIARLGCVEDHHLTAWNRRQPADPTAAERMKRFRERQKTQEKSMFSEEPPRNGPASPDERDDDNGRNGGNDDRNDRNESRNQRNVTSLLEQRRKEKKESDSLEIPDEPEHAAVPAASDGPSAGRSGRPVNGSCDRPGESPEFCEFYAAYPRHVGRPAAAKEYRRAQRQGVSHAEIMAGLGQAKTNWRLRGTSKEYIPHPSTWLSQQRWADDDKPETVRHREPITEGYGMGV